MNNIIEAIEIKRQSYAVEDRVGEFTSDVLKLIQIYDGISSAVHTEDSQLANSCIEYAKNYEAIRKMIQDEYLALSVIMRDYAKKSLNNEAIVREEVKNLSIKINTSLATITNLRIDGGHNYGIIG